MIYGRDVISNAGILNRTTGQCDPQQMMPQYQQMGQAPLDQYSQQFLQVEVDPAYLKGIQDALLARVIKGLASSAKSLDPNIFADISALVAQVYGQDSLAYQAWIDWAKAYGIGAQAKGTTGLSGIENRTFNSWEGNIAPEGFFQQQIYPQYPYPQLQSQFRTQYLAKPEIAYAPFVAGRRK